MKPFVILGRKNEKSYFDASRGLMNKEKVTNESKGELFRLLATKTKEILTTDDF
jgi:hypothetical protein